MGQRRMNSTQRNAQRLSKGLEVGQAWPKVWQVFVIGELVYVENLCWGESLDHFINGFDIQGESFGFSLICSGNSQFLTVCLIMKYMF